MLISSRATSLASAFPLLGLDILFYFTYIDVSHQFEDGLSTGNTCSKSAASSYSQERKRAFSGSRTHDQLLYSTSLRAFLPRRNSTVCSRESHASCTSILDSSQSYFSPQEGVLYCSLVRGRVRSAEQHQTQSISHDSDLFGFMLLRYVCRGSCFQSGIRAAQEEFRRSTTRNVKCIPRPI